MSLMLGGNPTPGTEGKWNITKKDLEAVLEFAKEIQRFTCRTTDREENAQPTPIPSATGSTGPDEFNNQFNLNQIKSGRHGPETSRNCLSKVKDATTHIRSNRELQSTQARSKPNSFN